ncbi:DUF5682 family protein [Kitasatospora sp. A2-31]|uniref:DUF5682 family protein n=1 Tax=Kitasatospora sp. A2-31 TaxID=2916414 RepID=UPI001EEA15E9|nr:DUF5682 family protein [Kitasatospora sp. A2-31]MCG6495867.1 DUF5682 family protein [Kitasatospora sp. A2-31]
MTTTSSAAPPGREAAPGASGGTGGPGGPARSGRSGRAAGTGDPRAAVEAETARLAAAGVGAPGPYLIGVRHHAPSLSAAVPALLDAVRPEVVLVELPAEFQPWLGWLADDSTRAPVALAAAPGGSGDDGPGGGAGAGASGLAFYPFADFSPELAALRWARRNGVEAVACDLPLAQRADAGRGVTDRSGTDRADGPPATGTPLAGRGPGVAAALRRRLTGRDDDEDLWDRLVETAAPGSTPEAVRRAALLVGWAMRRDAEDGPGVDPYDLRREAWMRARIAAAASGGRRVAAVVGAFHAPALLDAAERPDGPQPSESAAVAGDPGARAAAGTAAGPAGSPVEEPPADGHVVSLIPYTYPLLDARSGYPAGIRDPEWQHTVLEAGGDRERLAEALVRTAVRICEALRTQDHPAGPADAREIVRLAGDLARLRGLSAPGRGELVEAVQTVLAQGEPLGRGRAVARALERVLVGTRTGRAAPAAPRSGLAPAVEALLAELGLPGPADAAESSPRDLRLDPLRSPLDRRRELLLHRLTACGVPYGEPLAGTGAGGIETIGTRWQVQWTPATAAMLTVAGTRGVTPAQAAEGALRERLRREQQADGPTARDVLQGLADAAACGLAALADVRLAQLTSVLPESGTLPELLDGLALLDRLTAGHAPGLPAAAAVAAEDHTPAAGPEAAGRAAALAAAAELLTVAAVRQLEGVGGSDDPADARALLELAGRADRSGGLRLGHVLAELANGGSPLVRGAAGSVRVLLGHDSASAFGGRAASWVDGATDPAARHALARSLVGMLTAAEGLLATAPEVLEPVLERVTALADTDFLDRLPALRGGFDTLSPAARDRLLTLVEERLGTRVQALPDAVAPALFARWAGADLAARTALGRRGLLPAGTLGPPAGRPAPTTAPPAAPGGTVMPPATEGAVTEAPGTAATAHALTPAERWRLLLGRPGSGGLGGRAARLATALDELYGTGHGEGSGPRLDGRGGAGGQRGGRGAPYPGVREWSEELVALFGPGIREEVLAAAVAHGRTDALSAVDPDTVRPSVDLLRTVLEHAGGLPEARIAALRPLVRRLVAELTRELATRLRPALTGVGVPRPSRRPGGGLDLDRTIRANLATARPAPPGPEGERGTLIVPERPVFRTRARKAADWRLILVVDVSGSMEASTVWAALTASILAGVPSLSTHFVAFSTEVVDLTERVRDPLSLLLEVRIGGGTSIATGLKYARDLVTVPSRTLVAVISDFEEGGPVGGLLAQTRALVDSGCHVLGCAALDDTGKARYSKAVAGQLVAAGMPVAALSPLELARWVGEKVR